MSTANSSYVVLNFSSNFECIIPHKVEYCLLNKFINYIIILSVNMYDPPSLT